MPSAADVGPDYKIDTSSSSSGGASDAAVQAALDKACPADARQVLDSMSSSGSGTSPGEVSRDFVTSDDRSASVTLGPVDPKDTAAKLDAAIGALNKCGTVTFSDADGYHYSMTMSAKRDDTYGDLGLSLTVKMTIDAAGLTEPIAVEMRMRNFHRGSVDASVMVTSGFDPQTMKPVPGDFSMLDSLSADLDQKISAL